jgi:hypothetical protein
MRSYSAFTVRIASRLGKLNCQIAFPSGDQSGLLWLDATGATISRGHVNNWKCSGQDFASALHICPGEDPVRGFCQSIQSKRSELPELLITIWIMPLQWSKQKYFIVAEIYHSGLIMAILTRHESNTFQCPGQSNYWSDHLGCSRIDAITSRNSVHVCVIAPEIAP